MKLPLFLLAMIAITASSFASSNPTNGTEANNQTNTQTSSEPQPDVDEPSQSQGRVETKATGTQIPSRLSKSLSNKLYIAASYGLIRIPKAKLGKLSAQGVADISALWNIRDARKDNKFLLSFRYAPVQSENEIDGQSYRSIIEGYYLGGQYRHHVLHKNLEVVAGAELGYLLVYQESRDKFSVQADSENNELIYTVATGLDWLIMDKLNIGPRVYAGFGDIQTVQVSGSVSFIF